jgi:hypothetical protein
MTDECDFRVTLLGTGVPAHLTIPQQHEPITYAFGVDQLVDRKNETAATAGNVTDHAHDLARLPQRFLIVLFGAERSIWHEQSRRQSVTSSSTTNTIGVACDIADDPESWPTTLAGSMVFACILGRKSAAYCSGHSKSRPDGLT